MEKSYLSQVAKKYCEVLKSDGGLSWENVCFVFPNRRAGLYFKREIQRWIDRPVFVPKMYSVNELFYRYTDLKVADRVDMTFVLYEVYRNNVADEMLFADFVGFADSILRDFDELDKYMVDVKMLFSNVSDLQGITADYLTDEQKGLIVKFWGHAVKFNEKDKVFNESFEGLWAKMFEVYTEFKKVLREKGVGYDGMLFRDVVEGGEDLEFDYERYVFVGFNALNVTEGKLLDRFKSVGDYYFDYPKWIVDEMSETAGCFAEDNMRRYKSVYELDEYAFEDKNVKVLGVASNVAQVQVLNTVFEQLGYAGNSDWQGAEDTLVMLPDENMLVPTINVIPKLDVGVNVTMGYPLRRTSIAGFIESVIFLYRNKRNEEFYYKNVLSLLNHSFLVGGDELFVSNVVRTDLIKRVNDLRLIYASRKELFGAGGECGLLKTIFSYDGGDFIDFLLKMIGEIDEAMRQKVDEDDENNVYGLDEEYIGKYVSNLKKIQSNMMAYDISTENVFEIIVQMTMVSNVPFEGEPLQGLQVMGALEVRLLDFKNVVVLSFNDEKIPKRQELNSLIPYSLRNGFGLPTVDYNDKLYAYNFYRMMHRVENVYFVYDNRTEGVSKNNEISRYYSQMKYLYGDRFQIEEKEVRLKTSTVADGGGLVYNKSDKNVQDKLSVYFSGKKRLSASALNNYIDCPLKFYLANVLGIREEKELDDETDMGKLGSVFHRTMELVYEEIRAGRDGEFTVSKESLSGVKDIDGLINKAFCDVYKTSKMYGVMLLDKIVVKKLVENTLAYDKRRAPFVYVASEMKIDDFEIDLGDGRKVLFKGYIDRVDRGEDGVVSVIDYKTGNMKEKMKIGDLSEMFDGGKNNRPKEILQLLIYCYMLRNSEESKGWKLLPRLYAVKNLESSDIVENKVAITDGYFSENYGGFEDEFLMCVRSIFASCGDFAPTVCEKHCEYCQFKEICGSGSKGE